MRWFLHNFLASQCFSQPRWTSWRFGKIGYDEIDQEKSGYLSFGSRELDGISAFVGGAAADVGAGGLFHSFEPFDRVL